MLRLRLLAGCLSREEGHVKTVGSTPPVRGEVRCERRVDLDDLILELRDSLGAMVVVVTHELASIFTIGDNSVFLDADTKTMLAVGNPKTLRDTSPESKIRAFLTRGEADAPTAA